MYDKIILPPSVASAVFTTAGPLALSSANISGWQDGAVTRLRLTPASGGTTINTLDASKVQDGWALLVMNRSPTDYLYFNHKTGTGALNQFSNSGGTQAAIAPLGAAWLHYIGGVDNVWQFA